MLGPLTGWMSSKPSPSTEVSAPIMRYSHGWPRTTVSCRSGGAYSNTLHGPQPRFSVEARSADSMSATTTAICVIVMGTAGGTIRPPLPLAIRYLQSNQFTGQQIQVPGRVDPVEDGTAADDDVDPPARDLRRVGDGHPAVHADQHVRPGAPGQLAYLLNPLAGTGGRLLPGPARADRQDQDQVGQAEHGLDRADRSARVEGHPAQEWTPRSGQRGHLGHGAVQVPGGLD